MKRAIRDRRRRGRCVGEQADNVGVDKNIKEFANKYWNIAANHKKGEPIPDDKISIGSVSKVQIEAEKRVGRDITGYTNIIKPDFIKHVYDRHSNTGKEKSSGNIPITEADFPLLPFVVESPDFIISGLVCKNENRTVYGKYTQGTLFYVEQAQTRQKRLVGVSFYHANTTLDANIVLKNLKQDKRYDTSKAKISNEVGGHPHYMRDHYAAPAEAISAHPSIDALSP
jgi:hypothetical protein